MSQFVLHNNTVIFVLLFGKTAKLLLSSMTWVEETKGSQILVTCLRKKTTTEEPEGHLYCWTYM